MTKTLVINSKMQYSNILSECRKGNFEKTLDYITKNFEGNLDNKKALNILISCCNACFYCKEDASEEYLLKILNSVFPILKDLSETEVASYVQTLEHFIKFFIHKDTLETIVQIDDIIIPHFLPLKLAKKETDAYNRIAIILHNLVRKVVLEKTSIGNELLFKLSTLVLKICMTLLDSTAAVNLSLSYFKNLLYMKVSPEYQLQYYTELLNLLPRSCTESKPEGIVNLVLHLSSHILNSILNTYDFEKGLAFLRSTHSKLKRILNCEECSNLHQVLKIFVILSPLKFKNKHSELGKCEESLRNLDRMWETFDLRKDFIQHLNKLLRTLSDYYTKVNSKEWQIISEELQLQFFNFIYEISSFIIATKAPHDLRENLSTVFSNFSVIFSLIRNTVENSESSLKYHQACADLSVKYVKQIESIMSDDWAKAWNGVAAEIYKTGLQLLNQDADEAAAYYFYIIIRNFAKSGGINDVVELKYSVLQSTCTALIQIHARSKDKKKHLAFIALSAFLCTEHSNHFMSNWVTLKHNLKDDKSVDENEDMQKINLVSALQLLQEEVPELRLNNSDKEFLLSLELRNYKRKWKSKVPIVSALKDLLEISNGDYIVNFLVELFIDVDLPNDQEFFDIIAQVLDTCKRSESISKVNLAVLHYLNYKSCSKKTICKNAKDMERVAAVVPDKNVPDLADHNDEFDVLSSFDSLKLNVYEEILENLNNSLAIFTALVPTLSTDNFEHVTIFQLYNLLLNMSYEYKLLSFNLKAVRALDLALKVAQLSNDAPNIIKTVGFIIQQADFNDQNVERLTKVADALIEDESFSKLDNLEVSVMYYICKSRALLYHDYEESYALFKRAANLLEHATERNGFGTVKSQLFLLSSKMSMLPCNVGVETHKKSLLMNAYLAAEVMCEEYRITKLDDPYRLSVLIEANKELVKLYHYLKCPREVRMYGKEYLILTQKLVLPLHTASYLMYLAHADLLSNYQDDCYVKVTDMAAILSFNGKPTENCAAATYFKQHSPYLATSPCQMPHTPYHSSTCECCYCACYEYQTLALEKVRLSALINVKENNSYLAQEFFQCALRLYDYYAKKYSKKPGCPPDFLPSYGYVLLNYGFHLWRTNRKSDALNLNIMLLNLLDDKKLQNVNLYNEALVQKLGYVTENIIPEPVPDLQAEMDYLRISGEHEQPKTPENKQSEVSVIVDRPQFPTPQNFRVKLPLSFSPAELPKETAKKSRKNAAKTPAPKIQVYTESSGKKQRRKPNLNVVLPPVLPSTENVPASNHSSTDSCLKSRTKLLTEKLKQSTKKNGHEPSTSDFENPAQSVAAGRKNPARKNLLKELSTPGPELVAGTGAVRKSARTKK